ncbi:hypothetical protein Hypma_013948 [Hypsizygus marmoreus]|uniref:Uncharacterized protein n=1 Tax=Hypsizygus marmoreus TaxID=39966 RepID=A0A369KB65_HYPMA|nr:hypothetical protein Hypma_013948 [Hypsizygus marmoreus]
MEIQRPEYDDRQEGHRHEGMRITGSASLQDRYDSEHNERGQQLLGRDHANSDVFIIDDGAPGSELRDHFLIPRSISREQYSPVAPLYASQEIPSSTIPPPISVARGHVHHTSSQTSALGPYHTPSAHPYHPTTHAQATHTLHASQAQTPHPTLGDDPTYHTASLSSFGTVQLGSEEEMRTSAYVAVDPFGSNKTSSTLDIFLPVAHEHGPPSPLTTAHVIYPYSRRRTTAMVLLINTVTLSSTFLLRTLPRQLYLHLLLRLPWLYWSRVARIFEEARMAVPEIKKMALENVRQGIDPMALNGPYTMSPLYANLKVTWEGFIDSLLKEWKTLNIVSVLLLTAILTILQIESAAAEPITRNTAIASLICALMSLLYGCMYIIRFGTMKKIYKAAEWAEEAQATKTFFWWNVWVLLATPAIWLAWSLMFYITCIMAFVWRTSNGPTIVVILSPGTELAIRSSISGILALGAVCFVLILNTLRRYGDIMDRSFLDRVAKWVEERRLERGRSRSFVVDPQAGLPPPFIPFPQSPSRKRSHIPVATQPADDATARRASPSRLETSIQSSSKPIVHDFAPDPQGSPSGQGSYGGSPPKPIVRDFATEHVQRNPPAIRYNPYLTPIPVVPVRRDSTYPQKSDFASARPPTTDSFFKPVKVVDLRFQPAEMHPMPALLVQREFKKRKWEKFISEALVAWNGHIPLYQREPIGEWPYPLRPQDTVAALLEYWNLRYFNRRGTIAFLCQEFSTLFPESPMYAVYLVDSQAVTDGHPFVMEERFGPLPDGLLRIDIFDQFNIDGPRTRVAGTTSMKREEGRVHFDAGLVPTAITEPISSVNENLQPDTQSVVEIYTMSPITSPSTSPPTSPEIKGQQHNHGSAVPMAIIGERLENDLSPSRPRRTRSESGRDPRPHQHIPAPSMLEREGSSRDARRSSSISSMSDTAHHHQALLSRNELGERLRPRPTNDLIEDNLQSGQPDGSA